MFREAEMTSTSRRVCRWRRPRGRAPERFGPRRPEEGSGFKVDEWLISHLFEATQRSFSNYFKFVHCDFCRLVIYELEIRQEL
jgi:hypothetical protein